MEGVSSTMMDRPGSSSGGGECYLCSGNGGGCYLVAVEVEVEMVEGDVGGGGSSSGGGGIGRATITIDMAWICRPHYPNLSIFFF